MFLEIAQIKRFLAKHCGLALEGKGLNIRVVGDVPDGEHMISLGVSKTPTRVVVKNGRIHIGQPVG